MTKEKQKEDFAMKPEAKGDLQKCLSGLRTLALALVLMCLPMFAQTVRAEEQIKIELTYLYVNEAGDNSLYVDTQYVPAGTTWGDFFSSYQPCYGSGTITDSNAGNEWEVSVQNVTYANETDCYANEIKNFNQYMDCALVTYYGLPSTYKHAFLSYEYYENDVCVDSGTGWDLLMPASYAYGSAEALAYVERNRSIYSFIEEYCRKEGASVSLEAPFEPTDGRWDGYNVRISLSAASVSNGSEGSNEAGGTENTVEPKESTYTADSGLAMRRIAAEENSAIAIDGALDYLPAGAKFTSVQLTDGDTYHLVSELVSQKISGATGLRVFKMNLLDASNGAIHQLEGYINVTLPIPEGLSASDGKLLVVYRVEEDGTLTKCDTATSGGYLTFATNHFSTYVIVEETTTNTSATTGAITSPKTGEESNIFIFGVIALAAGTGCICLSRKKAA